MRSFLEILKFELRFQFKSPFLWGVVFLFFLIHLCTVTSVGVNLGQNHRIDINGAAKILQVLSAYIYLAMFPIVVFVIRSIVSDFERSTASFFFVTPVSKHQFFFGRFASAFVAGLAVGFAGFAGVFLGPMMPWASELPRAEFSWKPYIHATTVLVIPNLFIICALFFSVAALTRSAAMTFAVAAALLAGDAAIALYDRVNEIAWAGLADPFGAVAIIAESRYWTVPELNSNLPGDLLRQNRALWLTVAAIAVAISFWRHRLDLSENRGPFTFTLWPVSHRALSPAPRHSELVHQPDYSMRGSISQLTSQIRVDVLSVLTSPLVYVLLLGGIFTIIAESGRHYNTLSHLPYYPYTRLMLEVFYFGLAPLVSLMAIYYSGSLIHREKDSGVSEIVASSPYADWIMPASKTLTLCVIVAALLTTAMLSSIALQALAGYTKFEFALYLKSLFIYNGLYYWMLCVLAVFIQLLTPNKWFGMLLVFAAFVLLASLPSLGVEHILFNFGIPFVIYSDMNGYGPARPMVYSLILYWGLFCVLLFVAAHLLYPRGYLATLRHKLFIARSRVNRHTAVTSVFAALAFLGVGSGIFYNTNVLNQYRSTKEQYRLLAEYEQRYSRYMDTPAPSYTEVAIEVDIYPNEGRLESRGTGTLRNNKEFPISEFVISIDPKTKVNRLSIDSASLKESDPTHGLYIFTFASPLAPQMTVKAEWNMTRESRGFVSSGHDYKIVENGTLIDSPEIIPIPGFDDERFITNESWRRRFGLKPAEGLPQLGDPKYLGVLKFGVDTRAEFRAIVSTSADQIAVTSGILKKQWEKDGRRYFEYVSERPIWPAVPIASARYEVATDRWNNIDLEVYYDKKHATNIAHMLATMKRTLEYNTENFYPFPLSYFRILEYPGYRSAAQASAGLAIYPEVYGFITDLSDSKDLDYVTIHEMSHQWWGGLAYGAKMQGRQMLNETLAQYSTLMIFKKNVGDEFAGRVARQLEDNYLSARSDERRAENPLIYTNDQGNISYNRGPLAFYALQDVIGEDRVNEALRNYLQKFALKDAPFPTSLDVVNELRSVAGEEHQQLITDLFERIILHDLEIQNVEVQPAGDSFNLTMTISAHQFEADALGLETEVPLNRIAEIVIDPETRRGSEGRPPLYRGRHALTSGTQTISVSVSEPPASAEIDPYCKFIDRTRENNLMEIEP